MKRLARNDIAALVPLKVRTSREYKVTLVMVITKPVVSTMLYSPVKIDVCAGVVQGLGVIALSYEIKPKRLSSFHKGLAFFS
ncbi:MAG: hypothetical protein J7L07_08405 [Candidatus Odinarchaeota archaeon]|nr:hypothetical protein [Candidatus Odinarchaeota archaeon]